MPYYQDCADCRRPVQDCSPGAVLVSYHCVIPSEGCRSRGTPDLSRRWNMHLNHASSDVFGARSVVGVSRRASRKIRGPSATLGMTQRKTTQKEKAVNRFIFQL